MIFTALGWLLWVWVKVMTAPLPTVVWTPDTTGFDKVVGVMKTLDNGVPVTEALTMMGMTLVVIIGLMIWRGIKFIKSWIPGLGGSDD